MSSSNELPNLGSLASLRRFARRAPYIERCEMCGLELASDHQHLIEPGEAKLICACDACAVLFSSRDGVQQRLKRVPRQARLLNGFTLTDAQWNSLAIPIELLFVLVSSTKNCVVAFYPSPAGAIESLLPLDVWGEIVNENKILLEMQSDVEALLINRVGSARGVLPEYYIAPIDACYKLVGTIRMHWKGLSGGTDVWREIETVFESLKQSTDGQEAPANA